jgi:hypothetical protein
MPKFLGIYDQIITTILELFNQLFTPDGGVVASTAAFEVIRNIPVVNVWVSRFISEIAPAYIASAKDWDDFDLEAHNMCFAYIKAKLEF